MIKKTLLLAALCLSANAVMAQVKNPFEKYDCGIELGYGYDSSLDLALRGQWHLNKHITWDIMQFRFAGSFNNAYDNHEQSITTALTTGLRAYTPTFGPDMKFFASAGAGWGYYCTYDSSEKEKKHSLRESVKYYTKTHNLAADFSAGLFVWHGIYLSYSYQLLHNNSRGNYGNHFFNIGIEFGSMPAKWFKD